MHYEKIKNVKKLLINAIKLLIIELQMLDLIFNFPKNIEFQNPI